MNPNGTHSYEDKLLEFAYGELPAIEARAVEAHVKGCVRCADALESIQGVRHTMSQLEPEPAPTEGLESLLAYAQQKARQIEAGPAPRRSWWRWFFLSATGAAAIAVVAVVGTQTAMNVKLAPPPVSAKAEAAQAVRGDKAAFEERGRYDDGAQRDAPAPQATPAPEPVPNAAPTGPIASREAAKAPPPAKNQYAENKAVQGMEVTGTGKGGLAGGGMSIDVESGLGSVSTGGAEKKKAMAKLDIPATGTTAGKKKPMRAPAEEPEPAMAQAVPSDAKAPVVDQDRQEFAHDLQPSVQEQLARRERQQAPAQAEYRGGYGAPAPGLAAPAPAPSTPPAAAPAAAAPAPVASKDAEMPVGSLKLRKAGTRGTGSAASSAASDEFDSLFGGGQQPSSAGTRSVNEKAAKQDEGSTRAQAFVRLAEQARQKGDRTAEVKYLRQAVEYGAQGEMLATVLGQLCVAETSLGVEDSESCQRVVNEFPLTQWAERVKRMKSPAADMPSRVKTAPKKASEKSLGNTQQAF